MARILLGHFAPVTQGHLDAIDFAKKDGPVKAVFRDVGLSRNLRRPFTFEERREMLRAIFGDTIEYLPLRTRYYQPGRFEKDLAALAGGEGPITLETPLPDGQEEERVRWKYLLEGEIDSSLPGPVAHWLRQFCKTPEYAALAREAKQIQEYRDSWKAAPFPPIFVTVDAMVVWQKQLLMIKRGHFPGEGLWALPGGFVNPDEFLLHAALRELHEETDLGGLDIGERDLVRVQTFDQPDRSSRGRTISHVHLFEIKKPSLLAPPKAGDDAAEVKWVPLTELAALEPQIFEDHAEIIDFMLQE